MNLQVIDVSDRRWLETLQSLHHDIYQLPEYVCLEARRTHTLPEAALLVEADRIFFVPYLLRSCEASLMEAGPRSDSFSDSCSDSCSDSFDVVSPYGYPGILLSPSAAQSPEFIQSAVQQLSQVFRDKGICSAFFRLHPILNPDLQAILGPDICVAGGETISVDLTLSEEQIWNHTKPDHRNKINRCRRSGLTARMVPCADSLKQFTDIYIETMLRVGATTGYLEFNDDYFSQLHDLLGDSLHLCLVEMEDTIASAGLYTESQGIVQALFGGTRTEFVKQSPSSLETDFVRFWAKARGNRWLHLGGGVGATRDRLYEFKAGFSRQRHRFSTLRLVTDEERYRLLVEQRAKALNLPPADLLASTFFPAYRSSGQR